MRTSFGEPGKSTASSPLRGLRVVVAVLVLSVGQSVLAQTNVVQFTQQGSWTGIVSAVALEVTSNYAYLADGVTDLEIIDIRNPTNPQWVGSFTRNLGDPNLGEPGSPAADAVVLGNVAYVADGFDGLHIVDVSDPVNPTRLGGALAGCLTVYVASNIAYVGVELPGPAGPLTALSLVDVGTPTNSSPLGSFSTEAPPRPLVLKDHYLLTGIGTNLVALDVVNPTNPTTAGIFKVLDYVQAARIVGNTAFVAAGSNGLLVLDLNNPTNPALLGSYVTGGCATDVFVVDNYAYVADMVTGLLVLDVSNPASPMLRGQYPRAGCRRVRVAGNHAYIASAQGGLEILQVSKQPYISSVRRNGDIVVLTWRGAPGLTLQGAPTLKNSSWTDVPGSMGQSQIELPLTSALAFFRLAK